MLNNAHLARIDLNLLVLFDAVFAERHVGRAAERLNLTPSAVSHALARLRRLLNDPVFLRSPKGVVPTERAVTLAGPISEILARVGGVVSSAAPFDPATSRRRFTIGAPDAVAAVFAPPLLSALQRSAPGIDISLRQVLPDFGRPVEGAWEPALDGLDARAYDVAMLPLGRAPARFVARILYAEDFIVAARAGHPYLRKPTLARFCAERHLLVSLTGDPDGFVDILLARRKLSRRVALTVPNFSMAMALIAETDLIAALPRHLVAGYAQRFGVVATEAPMPLCSNPISVIATKAAMMDGGVAWLFQQLADIVAHKLPRRALRPRGSPITQ